MIAKRVRTPVHNLNDRFHPFQAAVGTHRQGSPKVSGLLIGLCQLVDEALIDNEGVRLNG